MLQRENLVMENYIKQLNTNILIRNWIRWLVSAFNERALFLSHKKKMPR